MPPRFDEAIYRLQLGKADGIANDAWFLLEAKPLECGGLPCPLHAFCLNRQNDIELWRPGSAGEMPTAFYFLFLRAGGADGAIARRWSVAERRATPGNGEEENQALKGR